MVKSDLQHKHEEILEHLWLYLVEDNNEYILEETLITLVDRYNLQVTAILGNLLEKIDIRIEGSKISLTEQGKKKGQKVVRRHRLAERLLKDVINVPLAKLESSACNFEHILSEDVEENICTLLGHPDICPHNHKIPPGDCCGTKSVSAKPAIFTLRNVQSGYQGVVSYLSTKKDIRLKKLIAFGITPGVEIKVIKKSPGTVIKVDESLIALESDVTNSVFLRNVRRFSN
ncbi:MAG: metal-dependent transcriptional regulator [Candidatus Hodarchaeales archaeon]|jgi:DtxR family Mn-dependent transcriptional regulator